MKPISPDEVNEARLKLIPDQVFEVFNNLILENWNGNSATVGQDELVSRIASSLNLTRSTVFDKHYLDVEDHYREIGWLVEYHKPDYTESWKAYFKFVKKRNK